MSEMLTIEVDGEIEDHRGGNPNGGSPTWGIPVAIAVVAALLLAVMVVAVLPAATGGKNGPTTASDATDRASTAGTAEVVDEEVIGNVARREDARVAATREALAAWGRFAATGNLDVLAGSFAKGGPQYRLLEQEGVRLAKESQPRSSPYKVNIKDPRVVAAGGNDAVVTGSVSWSRVGEPTQNYNWEVVLRDGGQGRWLLWTVRSPAA